MPTINPSQPGTICPGHFYGFTVCLYGKPQRYELYYAGSAVFLFQIIRSHIWLRYFRLKKSIIKAKKLNEQNTAAA